MTEATNSLAEALKKQAEDAPAATEENTREAGFYPYTGQTFRTGRNLEVVFERDSLGRISPRKGNKEDLELFKHWVKTGHLEEVK